MGRKFHVSMFLGFRWFSLVAWVEKPPETQMLDYHLTIMSMFKLCLAIAFCMSSPLIEPRLNGGVHNEA